MRRFMIGVVFAAVLPPAAALAQVSSVTISHEVTSSPYYTFLPASVFPNGPATDGAYEFGAGDPTMVAHNVQIASEVTPAYITFANNATSQGYIATTFASSTVVVNYTNGGGAPVTPILQSTVIPGGFGFYVDDQTRNPTATGFGVGDVNQTPQAAAATFDSATTFAPTAATASFTFDVYSGSSVTPVYSIADSVTLSLYLSPGPSGSVLAHTITAGAAPPLNGFGLVTPAGDAGAVAYQWNATTFDVPLGVTLAPGASSSFTYVTTVTANTAWQDQCGTDVVCPSLLAFAGFGDPIAKATGGTGGVDPYFAQLELGYPTFDPTTGRADVPLLPTSLPELSLSSGATEPSFAPVPNQILGVPEPGAWILMVTGVGFAGATARFRRRATAA